MTLDTSAKEGNEYSNTIQKQPKHKGTPYGLVRKTSERFNKKWRRKHGL